MGMSLVEETNLTFKEKLSFYRFSSNFLLKKTIKTKFSNCLQPTDTF
jgi:hypothetical protein